MSICTSRQRPLLKVCTRWLLAAALCCLTTTAGSSGLAPPGRSMSTLRLSARSRPFITSQPLQPQFVKDNPGLRIALLNLDVDLYEPTKAALESLYPLVVSGGIVLFDDYGWEQWPGASRAVDEYFAAIGEKPAIHHFPTTPTPGGYMVKR